MSELLFLSHPSYFTIPSWQDENGLVVAGITTKNGGVSQAPLESFNQALHVHDNPVDVIANRRLLAEQLAFPLETWVIGQQTHGTGIKRVNQQDMGAGAYSQETAVTGVDGLITDVKHVLLAAHYADCTPLFFYDPEGERIGIAHAGWKGTVKGMAREMVHAFQEAGTDVENVRVAIGPAISARHYHVDRNVVDQVADHFRGHVVSQVSETHYQLDLKSLNKLYCLEAGVPEDRIEMTSLCTYEQSDLFYSHRRDDGGTGRMLGFIGMSR
ncbi:peptidoglycan editing factor PgeF [Thalassobacillus sp. CUG 92003]|uniref:peptidoglycan editing factor PgeF n=1 Tax=Thalassobacillus sp. CUG 92003 TaxID=2736641 RepID=UPI003519F422